MNKFGKMVEQATKANEELKEAIKEEGDDAIADEAADLVLSTLLKALWMFRTTKEFSGLEQYEQEIIYGMIEYYETVLSDTGEETES